MEQKITSVEKGGFVFCRYFVALLVWLGLALASRELILVVFIILFLSAILTVKYAPMILIWRYTFGHFFKFGEEILNVKAMRFAHTLGSVLSGICVIFLYFGNSTIGWGIVWFLAIMKTISALGFCPASKLYVCMSNGGCCALTKKHD